MNATKVLPIGPCDDLKSLVDRISVATLANRIVSISHTAVNLGAFDSADEPLIQYTAIVVVEDPNRKVPS